MTAQVHEPGRPLRPCLDKAPRNRAQVVASSKNSVQESDRPLRPCTVDSLEGQLNGHVDINVTVGCCKDPAWLRRPSPLCKGENAAEREPDRAKPQVLSPSQRGMLRSG